MSKRTLGAAVIAIALLTSVASAVVGGPVGHIPGMLFAAILNPALWIGLPVGIWLLVSSKKLGRDQIRFFYKQSDGMVFGPYCSSEIVELTSVGTILPDTLISHSNCGPWRASGSLLAAESNLSASIYFYKNDDGIVIGPVTGPEIESATISNIIRDHTPISIDRNGPWKRAGELKRKAEVKV